MLGAEDATSDIVLTLSIGGVALVALITLWLKYRKRP